MERVIYNPIKVLMDEKEYILDFNYETANSVARALRSDSSNDALIKWALKKNHAFEATDKVAEKIKYALISLTEDYECEYTFAEIIERLLNLFAQGADEEAIKLDEQELKFDIKPDGAVAYDIGTDKGILKFTRAAVKDFKENSLNTDSILAFYVILPFMIEVAVKNGQQSGVSVSKKARRIFNALLATKYREGMEDTLVDVSEALSENIKNVVESAAKNSKAAKLEM